MSTSTSIGRGPASGGNENHDGDPTHTTLGETVGQERPAGAVVVDAVEKAQPDGSNVETGPRGLDAARGKPHKPK